MDAVIRTAITYFFLLLLFRVSGNRTLSQNTTFDLVVVLIISEGVQQALIGQDYSMTRAALVVLTLIGLDVALSLVKRHSQKVEHLLDGVPIVIVDHGRPLHERMAKARVDEADVLEAARELQGLERLDQIKYAVLERSGGITIVPLEGSRRAKAA